LLKAAGLSAPSAHIAYGDFLADTDRVIDHAAAMGHEYIVVPYLDQSERTLDDYRRHSENFNRWGEACAKAGMQFAYHNHDFEFQLTDDAIPYDILLAEADANLVAMELDLAWASKGNADVLAYFTAWPGRFVSLHIKDMDAEGNEVDIGAGNIDFESIFKHAEAAGVKHGFVERDNPADVRYSVKHNFDAIAPLWNTYMQAAS
jgi:sugar phosphate isomerase/epimerase